MTFPLYRRFGLSKEWFTALKDAQIQSGQYFFYIVMNYQNLILMMRIYLSTTTQWDRYAGLISRAGIFGGIFAIFSVRSIRLTISRARRNMHSRTRRARTTATILCNI
jgi:hypothetical protein